MLATTYVPMLVTPFAQVVQMVVFTCPSVPANVVSPVPLERL